VSYLWRNSIDESFVREVEEYCGIDGVHISTHTTPVISAAQAGTAAPVVFAPLHTSVSKIAAGLGARVILTGQNGDLTMGNWFDDSLQVAANLRRFRLGGACKEALAWSKILGVPVYFTLARAFRAALPASISPAVVYTKPDGSYAPRCEETSLAGSLLRATASGDTRDLLSKDWMAARPERRKHFRALSVMLDLRTLQVPEPLQQLDYTHPFAHRPLVEFLMTIPPDVLCGPGEPRRLMRRALSGLWPPKLRKRRSKGLFGVPCHEALQPLVRDLLRGGELHVVEHGFVDRASFVSRLERSASGVDCNEVQLQRIVLLEIWLRNRRSSIPAGATLRAA
jgi:hypothetical protein